jgi:gamma-glutamyl phosphate reductase
MTAPASTAPAGRALDDILNDLDDHLAQIREAAEIVLEAAIGADIQADLYERLSFGAKAVETYVIKARACSDEAFDITRKVSAVLAGAAA